MAQFTLTIELGEGMQTGAEIANALRDKCNDIRISNMYAGQHGTIMDAKGNLRGKWGVIETEAVTAKDAATNLLRRAEYQDGTATVLTQDCEALADSLGIDRDL